MPVVPTRHLVARAARDSTAVAAFNVITLEHAEAVIAAAATTGRPVILQISQNAVAFHDGDARPLTGACASLAERADVDVALHLDHVEGVDLLHAAVDAGFSSVMYDAGRLPHAENARRTREAAEWAHAAGLWVEAEIGYVGGKPDSPVSAHAPGARTDPEEARRFVADTGVDALAVAVGSSHAMTSRSARLDHELIARLAAALDVPLVLHGSSGVPDDELAQAVRAGIRKVNIGTALGIAYTQAVRSRLGADAALVDPRKFLSSARSAMTQTAAALLAVVTAGAAVSAPSGPSPS
jgi:fructose-bisphosphate aldolase, class II